MGRKNKKKITLPEYTGDHGTGAKVATEGTILVPFKNNPNKIARRQRIQVIDGMNLTMRQQQAAKYIEVAYCKTEALSSGGPLKEYVQSSPQPDAAVAAQCDAISTLVHAMKPVKKSEREIVEHVCFKNKPLRTLNRPRRYQIFREVMDRVANHLRY